jgi:proteic killer suppression protein
VTRTIEKIFTRLVNESTILALKEQLLKIVIIDKKLRELCEKQAVAVKKLGDACAKKLHSRLADIEAANCVTDIVAGRPHALQGSRAGQIALDLAGGYRLVFAPANDPIPRREDQSVEWSRVTIISIEYIGDCHE